MPKKKFYPPNDTGTQKRRFRCLLFQRPKAYPNRPRSNKNNLLNRGRMALSNQRGDFYISDAVKIIIAVVLGALLLAALTLIFNDTVIPRITEEIESLFS